MQSLPRAYAATYLGVAPAASRQIVRFQWGAGKGAVWMKTEPAHVLPLQKGPLDTQLNDMAAGGPGATAILPCQLPPTQNSEKRRIWPDLTL